MRISFIIPVYNVAPYLRECLDSVLAQKNLVWEAICVDDGSTDGSGSILDEYAARDARFHVIHQTNRGEGVARNQGLDVAMGDWLYCLDADDVLMPTFANQFMALIETPPNVDLIISRLKMFDESHKLESSGLFGKTESYDTSNAIPVEVAKVITMIGGVFLKRSICPAVRFREGMKWGADRIFVLDCVQKSRAVLITDACLSGYRQHAASIGHASMSVERLEVEIAYRVECMTKMRWQKPIPIAKVGWIDHNYAFWLPSAIAGVEDKKSRDALLQKWFEGAVLYGRFGGDTKLWRKVFRRTIGFAGWWRSKFLFFVVVVGVCRLIEANKRAMKICHLGD